MNYTLTIVICSTVLWGSLVQMAPARSDSPFSPRNFCERTGGKVSETGDRDIYICCYRQQHKCVLSNIDKGYSRVITLSAESLPAAKGTKAPADDTGIRNRLLPARHSGYD